MAEGTHMAVSGKGSFQTEALQSYCCCCHRGRKCWLAGPVGSMYPLAALSILVGKRPRCRFQTSSWTPPSGTLLLLLLSLDQPARIPQVPLPCAVTEGCRRFPQSCSGWLPRVRGSFDSLIPYSLVAPAQHARAAPCSWLLCIFIKN